LSEFFHMGGYAIYIWSAYAVTAVLLSGLVIWTLIVFKLTEKKLSDLEASGSRRRQRRTVMETLDAEP
jgi:heme exporter protein D